MSEMVERVAKVLQAADESFAADEALDPANIELARAAIEAMREPTPQMRSAGENVDLSVDFDEPGRSVGFCAAEVYRSMIDAALKEP